ncbi:mediator complex subunit 13 C-terminal-domain-containing protein [Hysterangium stoloniferum]|nr:mediator complex subunit 13 C-terminal-domain-containing protein [Hysterangium stoloniferum]
MSPSTRNNKLPRITEHSQLLLSTIYLPPQPSISYTKFVPALHQEQPHKLVDLARQKIVNDTRRCAKSITDSLLPIVCVGKGDVCLWVFFISSQVKALGQNPIGKGKDKEHAVVLSELEDLAFDGLQRRELSFFNPSGLYPCSAECAKLPLPCLACTASASSSPTTLLPRIPLRRIYSLFIDAVRDRLIDDICIQSQSNENKGVTGASKLTSNPVRLGCGFLAAEQCVAPLWGGSWERQAQARQVSSIYVLTRLLPLPPFHHPSSSTQPSTSTPVSHATLNPPALTPGTPVLLAPYPTPAFYVSTHPAVSIPSSLRAQFWDALSGLGASASPSYTGSDFSGMNPSAYNNGKTLPVSLNNSHTVTDIFILVYIPVVNPQGEHKGVAALWPAHITFIDTSPTRIHLTTLPEIPGMVTLLTPPRGSTDSALLPTTCLKPVPPMARRRAFPRGSSYHLSHSQRSFRALELSACKRAPGIPIHNTAKNTAGYVENVAKEREKERERANQERIRRERELKEGKSSSIAATSTTISTINPPQTILPSTDIAGPVVASPKIAGDSSRSILGWHSVSTDFFAKLAQENIVNSFYPSPPDWNPNSTTMDTSSSHAATNPTGSDTTALPQAGCQSESEDTQKDALDSLDLGMDLDVNDMKMSISLTQSIGILDVNMDVSLMDSGFGNYSDAFTDDDFNYFDTAPEPEPMSVLTPGLIADTSLNIEESDMDRWLTTGLARDGMRSIMPSSSDATARLVDAMALSDDEKEPPAPDLIPSSPAKTPSSPGNPPTPSWTFNSPPPIHSAKSMFEPIYFGDRHHMADGKYMDVRGKFAFPDVLPRSVPLADRAPDLSNGYNNKEDGWKLRYDAITDPRVGVIKRLRGVKRKQHNRPFSSKTVDGRLRDEEWENVHDYNDDAEDDDDSISSSEIEGDFDELEFDQDHADDLSSQSHPSRPSTPPPPGLPLITTLLYTHLEHSHLLPLGVTMRPSYEELVAYDPPPALASVPTPVSPAAALGSASERSKTLELFAQAIAKETVENEAWAQAWGATMDGRTSSHSTCFRHRVPQQALHYLVSLIRRVPGLAVPSPLSDWLEPASSTHGDSISNGIQLLHPPMFSIGRAGLVYHVLPSAIRFWEKEGLGPRGGAKDVLAFALFEEGEEKSGLVASWMDRVGRAYNARGFGTHKPGDAGSVEGGLVPVQFETVRKVLPNLISALPSEPQHVVIYIITPPSLCSSLESSALRSIIKSQKCVSKLGGQHDFDQDRILVHFVPDYCVADPYTYPATRHVGLECFVNSIYDRLLRVTRRQTSRQFGEYSPAFENRFQVPAFVLARKASLQTHLQWDERPSLNVLDRHTFLHVGYCLSRCKRWLLAACIDERGEAHDVGVWSVPNHNDSHPMNVTWMVSNIWIFVKLFSQQADTEWRIVISKLGEIGEIEVAAWTSHLETVVSANAGPPVHVSLVCAQNDIPLPFLCSEKDNAWHPDKAPDARATTVFTDISSATYNLFFPHRTPIISNSLLCPLEHLSLVSPTPIDDEGESSQTASDNIGILPLGTTALLRISTDTNCTAVEALYVHFIYAYKSAKSTLKKTTHEVHADITRNWHDLAILTHERWHYPQSGLPFHLAALELMSSALDPVVLIADTKEVE